MGYDLSNLIRLRLDTQKINKPKEIKADLDESCWPGYEAIGTKELDGKTVPNCVPIVKEEQSKVKEGFPIPSPSGEEDESTFISRCNKEIYDEYPDDAQRNAICYAKWSEK